MFSPKLSFSGFFWRAGYSSR